MVVARGLYLARHLFTLYIDGAEVGADVSVGYIGDQAILPSASK